MGHRDPRDNIIILLAAPELIHTFSVVRSRRAEHVGPLSDFLKRGPHEGGMKLVRWVQLLALNRLSCIANCSEAKNVGSSVSFHATHYGLQYMLRETPEVCPGVSVP